MKFTKLLSALLLGVMLGLCACTSASNLPSGSVYGNDSTLFNYEKIAPGAFDALNVFVTWEFNYRAQLAQWPEIKTAADNVRTNAKKWRVTVIGLHNAYVSNPTDANRSALNQELAVIDAALKQATLYMNNHTVSKSSNV